MVKMTQNVCKRSANEEKVVPHVRTSFHLGAEMELTQSGLVASFPSEDFNLALFVCIGCSEESM